ncbi:MAG: hypothetical protein GXP42_05755 [Chloroflexi bacterium]|nr:hypothetical protein [Chloroflexota bacterium]
MSGKTRLSSPSSAHQRRAFVLRIWHDPAGRIWGQLVDPAEQWRRSFVGFDELRHILLTRLLDLDRQPRDSASSANKGRLIEK